MTPKGEGRRTNFSAWWDDKSLQSTGLCDTFGSGLCVKGHLQVWTMWGSMNLTWGEADLGLFWGPKKFLILWGKCSPRSGPWGNCRRVCFRLISKLHSLLCVTSGKARILFHLCVFYSRVSGGQGEKQDYMETPPLSVEVGSYHPLTPIIAVLFVTWLGWGLSKSRAPSCSWNAGLRKEDKYAPPPSITIVFSWNQTEMKTKDRLQKRSH